MKTYLRILAYVKPYKRFIAFYSLFTVLNILFAGLTFAMLQPMLEQLFYPGKQAVLTAAPEFSPGIGWLIAYVKYQSGLVSAEYGKSGALMVVTLFIVFFNVLGNIFKFGSNYYLGTIRTRVVEDIRESVFARLLRLHVAYIEGGRKGDIMSRITSDVTEVEYSVVITFESIVRDPLSVIFFLMLMLRYSVTLTLFIFVVLPIAALLVGRISKALKQDAVDTQDTYGRIMSSVDETISGIRVVKAFDAEPYIKKIFDGFNQYYSFLTRRQWHKKALVPIFSESAMVLTVGIVLWVGGNMVYSGEIESAAGFITYIGYFFLISRPAKSLSSSFGNIFKGIASAERIFQLMDTPVDIKDKPEAVNVSDFQNSLEIKNLSFAYLQERVLKDINLKIEKGKIYALVGPSGSGKSTLAELLLRFYDPTEGQILLDGHDLRDLSQESIRSMTAVVTQEAILFNDTIYNNIAFGMKGITEADIISAAKAANAHDFIMETEKGYHTNIGDRGGLLSGGQRQRLSIARAVLKNPPILILDEATSALDTSSEKIVQEALYRLMANRTSIVIAHRLSTIQEADQIIVLEKGEIVEEGNHRELLAREGVYKMLYSLQQLEN